MSASERQLVFYFDVMGFGKMALEPGAPRALDALGDLALLLSEQDQIAHLIQSPCWSRRFALSDSVFLLSEDPSAAVAAAAEIFFSLLYLNASVAEQVLIRGALTHGEAREVRGLFPETGSRNLVGEAVVRAVGLEQDRDLKGPRLFVSEEVERLLPQGRRGTEVRWILRRLQERPEEGIFEVLWLLPPRADRINELYITDVARACAELFVGHATHARHGAHYIELMLLVLRSLHRLRERNPSAAGIVTRGIPWQEAKRVAELLPSEERRRLLAEAAWPQSGAHARRGK